MTVDNQQRLWRICPGGWGIFYAIRADGTVQWWYHTGWQTGSFSWANGATPRDIGSGFNDFIDVLGSTNGTLWGIYGNGDVLRYRYICTDLATGAGYWENNGTGVKIGSGLNKYPKVFGGPDDVLWCVDKGGDLWRSTYTNGALSAPVKVGSGFNDCKWLAADSGGVIYGVRMTELYWWRYVNGAWVNNGMPIQIGDGSFDDRIATYVCAAGTGLFYSVDPSQDLSVSAGNLTWQRLTNYQTVNSGGAQWANNATPTTIGSGFTVEQDSVLQGYAWPPSATPGQTVGICASTTHDPLTVSIVRHDLASGPAEIQAGQSIAGKLQILPTGFVTNGCGWSPLINVAVPTSWPSGLYSAKLGGPHGKYKHMPFIVKPIAPAAPVAVVLPTLTYAAYNTWGGHSAYNNCPGDMTVQLTLQRPARTTEVEPAGRLDFEMYSDLLLLRWLNGQGYAYDVYVDQDLHANPGLLTEYRAVVLGSHPEYVTTTMRQSLVDYLNGSGRLVYTGGNGIYEPCSLSADLRQAMWRVPDGGRHLYRDSGLPESQILGVAYVGDGWATNAPYKVVNNHPILAGTGLATGSLFGYGGYNHNASGWEFDMIGSLAGSASPLQVIAHGQNTSSVGADMVWMDTAAGGFVFSASSLTFNGTLDSDAAVSKLMRNVMDRAVA